MFPDSGRAFQAATSQRGRDAVLFSRDVMLALITWSRWLSVSFLYRRVTIYPFVFDKRFVGRYSETTPISYSSVRSLCPLALASIDDSCLN